jgi:hypothetical protein
MMESLGKRGRTLTHRSLSNSGPLKPKSPETSPSVADAKANKYEKPLRLSGYDELVSDSSFFDEIRKEDGYGCCMFAF